MRAVRHVKARERSDGPRKSGFGRFTLDRDGAVAPDVAAISITPRSHAFTTLAQT
jgi:hypothetical protein